MIAVGDRLSALQRRTVTRHRGARPSDRRRRRLPWLLLGAWAFFCAAQLSLAYGDAREGMRAAVSARQDLGSEGFDGQQAQTRLKQARGSFDRAHRHASSPMVAPLKALPVLGRQLRSFADLTVAASRLAGVAATGAEAVSALPGDALPTGADRVALLRDLADRAATAETALGRVQLSRRGGLIRPLNRSWAVLERDVASTKATLRTVAEGLDGVAGVLEGPRRYLLLVANNAEMRAGSGMFLSIGTIETAGGSMKLGPLRSAGELTLPGLGVGVDGELDALWGWLNPGREWRNLATTPRFDITAPLAIRMWESLSGERLDGVLALDVLTLEAILGATGPVRVDDVSVGETNVVDRLLRDQYQGLDFDDTQVTRREELGGMAAAVVEALENGSYTPGRLAAGMARTSRGRHLLAWSSNPDDQQTWEKTGIAGSLRPTSLAVNILNRGGNKLDPFLDVQARLELREASGGTEVTVRMKVANHAPFGLSPYVSGPHPDSGVAEGDYLGIVAVNLPGVATDIALDGIPGLATGGADGPTRVVAGTLLLPRGQEKTVTVQFRLPGSETSVELVPSARVGPIRWEAGRHQWEDDGPKVVTWRWE